MPILRPNIRNPAHQGAIAAVPTATASPSWGSRLQIRRVTCADMWPREANGAASHASNGASCAAVLAVTVLFNASAGGAVPELPDVPSGLRTRGQCDDAWSTPSKISVAGSVPCLDQTLSDPDGGGLGWVHCTPCSKLRGTLLAIAGAAPVALAIAGAAPVVLAVRVSHGTAYSPKAMGLVLIHLAMLSTASGWELPSSEESTDPETTTTGEVDGERDGRRLASSCDGWCVCPPRPCFPPVHVSVPLSSCPQRFNSTAAVMRVRHSRKRWWLRLRLCLGPFCGRWRLRLR